MNNLLEPVVAKDTVYITGEAFAKIDHTEIYWLAGTGFMINSRGTILMIDPLLIRSNTTPMVCEEGIEMVVDFPLNANDVPKLDLLVYTHSDDDHLGRETASILAKLSPQIYGPPRAFVRLARAGVDPNIVEICRYGDEINVGSIKIEVIKADHPWQLQDPERYGQIFREWDAVGFIVTTPDGVFLFPGDTRLLEEHLKIKDINLMALDVSRCEYHINIKGATTLANLMGDALLIPYHYGTYNAPDVPAHCGNPEDVFKNVKNRDKRERVIAPGESVKFLDGKEI